jgi:DNA polymerase III subunit delta
MTYQEILKSIRAKQYKPVYFLHGEESYYIDAISKYIEENVLSEGEQSFNQMIFYGKDADAKTIIDTASRYPMMASHQVVILKEAQDMKGLQDLQLYIEKAVPTTIFVICHKYRKLDARTKLAKALKAHAVVFESKKLYDNQVADWISDYLKRKKMTISPNAAHLIGEYLGTDLSKIANELEKLVINLPQGTAVNEKHIQDNIGISKDFNVFELQRALGTRNVVKANQIINYFISNPRKNPLVVVVGTLYNYFSKVFILHFMRHSGDAEISRALKLRSDYFLKEYKIAARNFNLPRTKNVIHILKEYDLRSKGVDNDSTNEGELMKEMIWKILH